MLVRIARSFLKDLKSKPKDVAKAVNDLITLLEDSESLPKSGLDYTKMEGQKNGENYYRIRIGDWRIGIEYIHPNIIIIRILVRGEIYRHFPPGSSA